MGRGRRGARSRSWQAYDSRGAVLFDNPLALGVEMQLRPQAADHGSDQGMIEVD